MRDADTSPPAKLGWPARIALGLGVLVLFCTSLLIGALAHADMAPTRRTVSMIINAALASRLMGKVELGGIDKLAASELRISSLQVSDPEGVVLELQGIEVRGSWLSAALSSHSASVLPLVRVSSAALRLRLAADGQLSLKHALRARPTKKKPKKPDEKPTPSRRSLWLQRIELGKLTVSAEDFGPKKLNVDGQLSGLAASLSLDPQRLRFDLDRVRIVERKLGPAQLGGVLRCHLNLPRLSGKPSMWGSFSGRFGQLELNARGSLVDGRIAFALDAPELGARQLSPFLDKAQLLAAPVRVSASLTGSMPHFRFDGRVELPALAGGTSGEIRTNGTVRLGEPGLIDLRLEARNANARLVSSKVVRSRIDASARVRVRLAGADSTLSAQLRSAPSWVNGVPVPPIAGTLVAARSGVECNLRVDEPGSPTDFGVAVDATKQARFALRASVERLGGVPRLRHRVPAAFAPARWRGRVAFKAAGRVVADRVDAAFDARLRGVELPSNAVRLGYAQLEGRVRGPLEALTVKAAAQGGAVAVGTTKVRSFRIDARGPVREAQLSAALETSNRTTVTAHALAEPVNQRLRNVRLAIERGSVQIEAAVAQVLRRPRGTRLEGIVVKGLGDGVVQGSLRVERGELLGKLSAKSIELKPLGRLMDVPYPIRGSADLDVDLARQHRGRVGGVRLRLRDVGYLTIGTFDLDLAAQMKGKHIQPEAKLVLRSSEPPADGPPEPGAPEEGDPQAACSGVLASLELGGQGIRVAGGLLEPDSWKAASGALVVEHAVVAPRCVANIAETIPALGELPVGLMRGKLTASLELVRRVGQRLPSIKRLAIRTDGLQLAARKQGDEPPKWRSDRLDVSVEASHEPVSGKTKLAVDLLDATTLGGAVPFGATQRANLAKLVLAKLSGATTIDLLALARTPKAARRGVLLDAPLQLSVSTPRLTLARFAAALPEPWRSRVGRLAGEGQLSFELDGKLAEPVLAARLRGWQLMVDQGQQPTKVDLDVLANYAAKVARVDAALEHEKRQVAHWSAELETDLGARIRGSTTPPPRGHMQLALDRLPLAAVPALGQRRIAGELSGKVKVSDIGGAPQIFAALAVDGMRIADRVFFDAARLRIQPATSHGPGTLTTFAELGVRGGGKLQLSGYGALRWKRGFVPSANDQAPAALLLIADQFPLQAVQPLVDDSISKLGGRLHGALRLAHKERPDRKVVLGGDMRLIDGIVHIPAAGQRLHHINARLRAAPNAIRVDDIVVQAASGRATGSMVARLNGLRLTDVTGKLVIVKGEEMPLIADGIPLGTLRGEFLLRLTRKFGKRGERDEVNVVLTAAKLHLQLPPKAGHKVQRLNDHPDISISHLTGAPNKLPRRAGAALVNVTVGLRNGEVSGHGVHIDFETDAAHPIQASSDHGVRGKLKVTGGSFNVLGKVFEVDRAEVRLRSEEPRNPFINLTAHWPAPDGSIIYADYVGVLKPVTREKIRFRSNPPRSQQAIVSLLLLGDEQSGRPSTGASAGGDRAASMARGVFATQLNDLLGGVTPGLATGLGTTKDGYLATSLIYQVSEKVTAKATLERVSARHAVGADAAAASGAHQSASRAKVTVDVRVAPRWLVRSSLGLVGGAGSGVEVIYQLRY